MASCMCLQVGSCQLGCLILLWVISHPPGGWLACCHAGLRVTSIARENRPQTAIFKSLLVSCANVLLLKANRMAKPKVGVDGSHRGHRFWDLLQPFSENSLPYPPFSSLTSLEEEMSPYLLK